MSIVKLYKQSHHKQSQLVREPQRDTALKKNIVIVRARTRGAPHPEREY